MSLQPTIVAVPLPSDLTTVARALLDAERELREQEARALEFLRDREREQVEFCPQV